MTALRLRHHLHTVLPEWVRERLVQLVAIVCLSTDFAFSAVLVWAPRSEFKSPLWRHAEHLLPLATWGLLGIVFTAVPVLMWWVQGRCRLGAFWAIYVLGTGYWGFWTILTAIGSVGPNGATGILAIFCATTAVMHILIGLAWLPPALRPLTTRS